MVTSLRRQTTIAASSTLKQALQVVVRQLDRELRDVEQSPAIVSGGATGSWLWAEPLVCALSPLPSASAGTGVYR